MCFIQSNRDTTNLEEMASDLIAMASNLEAYCRHLGRENLRRGAIGFETSQCHPMSRLEWSVSPADQHGTPGHHVGL